MSQESILPLVMRWLHILAAIVAVGGSAFLRLVLMPAASKALSDEEHERLRKPLMRRWKMFVHLCILLLLVSGVYNYLSIGAVEPVYHIAMSAKVVLSLLVFTLAIGLTGRFNWSAKIREKPRRWLSVLLLLALLVILIAGSLRMARTGAADVPADIAGNAR